MKVWKYELLSVGSQKVVELLTLPAGAKPLSCAVQHETIVLYCAVPDEPDGEWQIPVHVAGTGHPIPDGIITHWQCFGSHVLHGGALVFHVFLHMSDIRRRLPSAEREGF